MGEPGLVRRHRIERLGHRDAGIVGRRRFVYEILGGCVTDARRLASTTDGPGIYMSPGFEEALGNTGRRGS